MSFFLRTFMLFVFPSTVYGSEEVFNITRTTARNQEDQFVIPSPMCNPSSQLECRRFHMRSFIHRRRCECSCPYEASTFGFDSGSWSCLKNTEFRKKAGCTYKFQSKHNSFPVEVLETRWRQLPLTIRLPIDTCKIDISSSRYLECDGSWSGLGLSKNSDIFKLRPPLENDHGSSWDYEFEIKEKASLAGRVIKLQLNCAPAAKSSCVLFKIAGKIACPVDPTKKSSVAADGQSAGASGTVAAIVIVIILIIIVVAIIGFIIWKRKRGENVWLLDRVSSIVTILRNRSSSSKAKQEEQQQEQIYAEIPDQPVQPRYSQNTQEVATSSQTGTRTAILLSGGIVASEATDDDDGYAVPPDSPEYKELEDPNEQNTGVDDGFAVPPDSPEYKELENPNEQNTDDDSEAMKTENNSEQEGSREATNNPAAGPGFSAAADNRYVTKQRRKPPSPPQKGNDKQERGSDRNDDASVRGGEEGLDKIHDYEHLRDENRDVYQPLDRNTMNIR